MIALLRGQSLCAVFSAVANVVLLSVSTNDLSVAFYCFSLTILLHLAAFFALAGVTKTAFYKHYAAAPAPAQVTISRQQCTTFLGNLNFYQEPIVFPQEEERPLLGLTPATTPHHINLTSVAWSIRVELVTNYILPQAAGVSIISKSFL